VVVIGVVAAFALVLARRGRRLAMEPSLPIDA
jgi:hypothetical protein